MRDASLSIRAYRWLLRLYPAGFRESYGDPMERQFRDELAESPGAYGLSMLWLGVLADLALTIPVQFAREVWQDARHTLRLWANRPWHTGFAIAALAIGIGANTGVFSVVNGLLLRSLPFREPSRLASIHTYLIPHDSAQQFHEWRQQSTYLSDAALHAGRDVSLRSGGDAQWGHVAEASWNFFSVLGAQPVLGRAFSAGEDAGGRNQVAVIGYGLWQQLFAGDPRVLGKALRVDGIPLTIIGVAPPGFDYPRNAVLWKPAAFAPGNNGWEGIARLKPGVTWPQARSAYGAEMDRLVLTANSRGRHIKHPPAMTSLQDKLAGPVKKASLLLMAGVILILFIACTNVANLLLARTADRATELSVRSALGASRARLVQQLLTESVLLSLVAALAGLVIAFGTASLAAKVEPPPIATQSYSILDVRVLAFAVAASTICGVLFAILPSLYAGRIHAFGSRASGDLRRSRLIRETLVAAQVMLTIVLLAASVSVGRAFVKLMQTDRGFDRRGLVTVSVSLEGTMHQTGGGQLAYFQEALARVRRLPGVHSSSATEFLPLFARMFLGGPLGLDGRPAKENSMIVPVLADYFKTMGGTVLYGRDFTQGEVTSDAKVAVVNELFASEFGAPAEALGHQVTLGNMPPRKVVGVVKAMDYMAPEEAANALQIFVPDHAPGSFSSTFVARVSDPVQARLALVRDTIRSVDRQVPVYGVRTMEQRMDDALARPRFYITAVAFFAGFAMLLAVLGIYGVVSYAVSQRTREIGVRMALGTTPVRLRGSILQQSLLTVAAGALPGVALAMASGRFLESVIDGAKSVDIAISTGSVLFIALIASISIWAATRRIGALDITEILRAD